MPAVGSNSLFEIRLYSSLLGVAVQNRFWYFAAVAPSTVEATALVSAFENATAAVWQNAVSDSWDGVRITCDEVTANDNFFDGSTNIGPGVVTGDVMPPHAAAGIRLLRATKDTQSGWKRIAGVAESQQVDGKLTAGAVTLYNLLGIQLSLNLTASAETCRPVIVRKTYTGDPPVLNPASAWIYNDIASRVVLADVTTQNTRKFPRGT